MRLDKYIKLTRLIKRREVAKVLIDEGSILVNDKRTKPSYEVKIGDTVTLKMGRRLLKVKIIDIKDVVNKQESSSLFSIIYDELTTI